MVALGDLPFEIIDNICLQLRNVYYDPDWPYIEFEPYQYWSPDSQKARDDLLSLCLTSKGIRQIATPHLYHNIHVRDFDQRATVLAESFLENENLANLVSVIQIEPSISLRSSSRLAKHFAKQPVHRPPLRYGGTEEAVEPNVKYSVRVLDFLLSSLRNLRVLNVVVVHDLTVWDLFGAVRYYHGHKTSLFSKLEELNFRDWDTEIGFALNLVMPLLALNKVTRCGIRMCSRLAWDREVTPDWTFPTLLELRMPESGLNHDEIEKLLQSCPNLELFRYELGNEQVAAYSDDDYASASDISDALKPLRRVLRTLIVSFSAMDELKDDFRPMQSLVDFEKLEYLSTCSRALTYCEVHQLASDSGSGGSGTSANGNLIRANHGLWTPFIHKLPKSIKSLLITYMGDLDDVDDVHEVFRQELSKLAHIEQYRFPNLTKLTVNAGLGLESVFEHTGIAYLEIPACEQIRWKNVVDGAGVEHLEQFKSMTRDLTVDERVVEKMLLAC